MMSIAQIMELLILCCIVFALVNKLISILGNTNQNDRKSSKAFFGEKHNSMKNVTPDIYSETANISEIRSKLRSRIKDYVTMENIEDILDGMIEFQERTDLKGYFSLKNFLMSSKRALKMIIDQSHKNMESLNKLIDQNYLNRFLTIKNKYGGYTCARETDLKAIISDFYVFGNNAFIKVIFSGSNITDNIKSFNEEWTYTKNISNNSKEWYLSNVEEV